MVLCYLGVKIGQVARQELRLDHTFQEINQAKTFSKAYLVKHTRL